LKNAHKKDSDGRTRTRTMELMDMYNAYKLGRTYSFNIATSEEASVVNVIQEYCFFICFFLS